jgi:transcriptional regulator with XRE-family HTH domain
MFDMGKRICKLRRDAHLSQKQLGEKIGKSASTIGSYENDTAVPTLENAAALAEALHVSLDYLLYGEKSRTLPLQKMSENRVQLLTDLAQEFAAPTSHGAAFSRVWLRALLSRFAAPTSHGAAFSDRKLDILRRLYQEFYR